MRSKLRFRDNLTGRLAQLKPDKPYIFPSGFGFAFGVLSFILLVMAIGYGNNILYFFVFLLVSMGVTTSWLTNKNIELVKVTDVRAVNIFCDEINPISLQVSNPSAKQSLWDIEFKIEYPAKTAQDKLSPETLVAEVQKEAWVSIQWVPGRRGLVRSPRIIMQSRFPFKLFRSWKYYHANHEILVYPKRAGKENLLGLIGHQSNKDEMSKADNEGLFRDYREFQTADSPARIDWKRSIKHRTHLVKNYEKSGERKILIDWEMTDTQDTIEDRISQLALWVDICNQKKESYSLKIKSFQTEYYSSANHYKNCMEKLALLTEDQVI